MAQSTKTTARLLDKTEAEFVERTQRAAIVTLSDQDLRELGGQLRERRNKARDTARRQRREMRGKAEPRGVRAAIDNSGTKQKADALTTALKRIGAETTRRAEKEKAPSQRSLARKALAAKQRQGARERPTTRTAGEGMRPIGNPKAAKSGALNDAGARPAMMRSKMARR